MEKIKVLNLYAGIGGNRKLWENVDVTAVELNPDIAAIYKDFFPDDNVIVADAHKYLLEHYKEFDFIWSSPPCPTHSRMRLLCHVQEGKKTPYPDMKLYQEIIFLKHWFKGKFVIENVISYYDPLIKPYEAGNHYFWSNFIISNYKKETRNIMKRKDAQDKLIKNAYFNLDNIDKTLSFKTQMLRNAIDSKLGLHIFNCAFKEKQNTILNF